MTRNTNSSTDSDSSDFLRILLVSVLMTLTTGLNERFFASFVIQFYCTYNMVQRRFLMLNDALYIILDIFYTSLGGSSLNFQNQRKARSVKL